MRVRRVESRNHVSVDLISSDELEVFFWVKDDPSDRYNDIYRMVYDISDSDYQNWTVARDALGQVQFDIVLTPEEIVSAVQAVNPGADATFFADPVSLGDTDIFVDDDGSKYLFKSYVSGVFGGKQGEGQIMAVKLTTHSAGDSDSDGDVDDIDLGTMFGNFTGNVGAAGGKTLADGDTDGDGDVDDIDLSDAFGNYTGSLDVANARSSSVPEPSTFALTLLGLVTCGWRRRRWRAFST